MKATQYKNKIYFLLAVALPFFTGCDREVDEDLPLATYPTTAEIFTDSPIALGSDFYFPYAGSKATAWSVDNSMGYESSASMRFDVPDANDPEGNYAGGIFRIDGYGRDLTGYDALTFYAKASQNVTIGEIGFGEDFEENKYQATRYGVQLTTNWVKYVIPIPDPSKLVQERGVFRYSAGGIGEEGQEVGYTFWIDDLKFEKLGTIGQARPAIQLGEDITTQTYIDASFSVTGLTQTFNLGNGQDVTVAAAPAYYQFSSSNPNTATVDENGYVSVVGGGTSTITASLAGVDASGSVIVNSLGNFTLAPNPTRDPANVISLFSDAYENVPVDYYNGFWAPYQTTLGGTGEGGADLVINGNGMINYTQLNFVGISTFISVPTLDLSDMSHVHVDINVQQEIQPEDFVTLRIATNAGTGNETNYDYTIPSNQLRAYEWSSFDIPLEDFNGLSDRSNVGLFVFVTEGTNPGVPGSITNILVDNLYYFNNGNGGTSGPTNPAPTPTQDASNVISIYSDAYTNLDGTDYPDWGQTTTVSNENIAGDNALLFSNFNYQGIQLAQSTDFSNMEYLHIDYWTENSTNLNAYLISTGPVETPYSLNVPTTGWVSVDIPLSSFSPVNLSDVIQMKFDGNGDIYLDNIYFYTTNSGGGSTPTTAAPTPTLPASNVISLFSNAYTNVAVDTFKTSWSVADFQEVNVSGNATLEYTNLDYVGIETTSSTVDASSMTHFHMDVWTPNATQISIKLVDFGANGVYDGGGDDSEHQIDYTSPAQGQWISYDIPLSSFTGLNSTAHLAQYILVGRPAGASTLYVDNIYFHN